MCTFTFVGVYSHDTLMRRTVEHISFVGTMLYISRIIRYYKALYGGHNVKAKVLHKMTHLMKGHTKTILLQEGSGIFWNPSDFIRVGKHEHKHVVTKVT